MRRRARILSGIFFLTAVLFILPARSHALVAAHLNYNGCDTCHGLHGAPSQGALLDLIDAETTCLSCHGPLGIATEATIHDPNLHGAGNLGYITCLGCHNPHTNGDDLATPRTNSDNGYNIRLIGRESDFKVQEVTMLGGLGAFKDVVFESSPADWSRSGDGLGLCNTCHGATHNVGEDCTGCHGHNDNFTGKGCTGCHDGMGAGALSISSASPHSETATGYTCEACHKGHEAGDEIVPNNPDVGIDYGSNGETGISLADPVGLPAATEEAEICWNCHEQYDPDISEWGTNSGGSYNYGSVDNNDLNWTTTNWQSANFSYKNGPLGTRPTDGDDSEPSGPGAGAGGDSSSLHATGGTVGTQSNVLGEVRCSYCHDVHDTMGPTGKPYLRGSWTPSAYPEDGAPQSGDTFTWVDPNPFSAETAKNSGLTNGPPRTMNSQNDLGGFQIDQNNPSIDHSAYNYSTDDALCNLCHPTDGSSTGFVGTYQLHRNIIPGFSNSTASARNIFQRSQRSTTNSRVDPWIAYSGITDYYTSDWMAGFREEGAGNPYSNIGIVPSVNGTSKAYGSFSWGVTVDDATTDTNFHNFTCSKCHNPHASRLPRLMITNCLDVQRNSWDDDYKAGGTPGNANWGNWPNLTPSSGNEGHQEIAYANTAQNCHRYFPAQSGSGTGAYEGGGWNKVTPW